ncbi:MAG: tetratricopeptide repeat protein [Candidatus Aminicenantales bacterium]
MLQGFVQKFRKRRIIETLAAFIGGGWLLVEVVERLLVGHYHFPEETIDLTVVSVIGALLATLVWRWFRSAEKRPGNVKVEVLLVPLIILATVAVDLVHVLKIAGITGTTLLTGIIALCLGIGWVILKLSQWASAIPESGKREAEVSSPTTVRPEKSIVVLPFTDLSPQKDQDYFCDGMTEEVIADLSHVRELLVISRSSAMTLKGSSKTVREIANDLNIRYVMEGSVRKAGNDLRITAQLIDAVNDAHIWAEKYSGTLDDVFDIQERVSRSVVKALELMLTSEEAGRMAERPIGNVAAYDCYLKAKHDVWSFTKEGTERAVQYLQNALDILGENANLYAGLGLAYFQLVNLGIKQEEYLEKAREYAQKTFALDPGSPQGHAVRGYVCMLEGDMRSAISHMKKAISSDPGDADTVGWLGWFYLLVGKASAAIPLIERSLKLDPVNPNWRMVRSLIDFFEGHFDFAAERLREAYIMAPHMPAIQFWYALSLAYSRRFQESLSILDIDKGAVSSDDAFKKMSEFLRATLRGEKDAFSRLQTPEVLRTMKRDLQLSYHAASFCSFLGQPNDALDWLENAINRGFYNSPFMEVDPFLDNIRGEERFKKLMERVKYEWEHFEV